MSHILTLTLLVITSLTFGQSNSEKDTLTNNSNFDKSLVKTMMLDYIFQFVSSVYFHIGADNIRSQIAISRLGTTKIGEQEVSYFGEQPKSNYVYRLTKEKWFSDKPAMA